MLGTGDEKWAVTYTDNSSHEVEESDDFDAADAYYEQLVSELDDNDADD